MNIAYRVFVLFALLLLSATASCTNTSAAAPTQAVSLRLKWVYDPGFAGEMVAAKAGIFKARGVDVTIKPGGFEADPIKLVASGADTFGVAGADSFLLARQKGVPIQAIAAGYIQTPVVFYALKSSGISSPGDFAARRIGYQAGQDTATVYEALMSKVGVDRHKVKEIPVRYDMSPLLTHQVDVWPGYAATQSYILQRQRIPYRVIEPSHYGISYLGTVYFARRDFIEKSPTIVQDFVEGLVRGWQFTYSRRDEATRYLSSYDPKNLTPALIAWNLDVQRASVEPSGSRFCEFSDAEWRSLARILASQHLLNDTNISGAYTTQFVRNAYEHSTQ